MTANWLQKNRKTLLRAGGSLLSALLLALLLSRNWSEVLAALRWRDLGAFYDHLLKRL